MRVRELRTLRAAVCLCIAAAAFGVAPARAAIVVDGRFDEAEWSAASRYDDFAVTQPYTLAAPQHPTVVRMVATPEGLAFAFECTQPPATRRQRSLTPRDADNPGDRVNVYLDLDADAKVAYNFTISLSGALQDGTLTNENLYSTDWDGDWQAAVVEHDDRWEAEVLIPWTIASMTEREGDTRTIAVLFDRVIAATAERSASPGATFSRPRYVSEFRKVEVAQYRASLLHFFPYGTAISDQVAEDVQFKFGADVFWKPSSTFQLTAAVNPDFGQVEADELVVNFEAIETFFSDRRPFFTENQAVFDLRTPDEGYLIYTRRIGGPRDDEPGRAAEIDAAVKLNGSARGFDYGMLTAFERDWQDDVGSMFYAQRLVHPGPALTLGYLGTYVDRPFLARTAAVNAVDLTWRPNAQWIVTSQVLASAIDDGHSGDARDAAAGDADGAGAWLRAFYVPNESWQHELETTHFDDALDFNDMGFQRRNSFNEIEYTITRRFRDFAADDPRGSTFWAYEHQQRWNDHGDRLPRVYYLTREAQQKSGATVVTDAWVQTRGVDDLISRGNGNVVLDQRYFFLHDYATPRLGDFRGSGGIWLLQEGNDDFAFQLKSALTYYARDNLSITGSLKPRWSRDWLVWQEDDQFASFERMQVTAGLDLDYFPALAHELRLKLQWVAIDAHDATAYRIGRGGALRESGEVVDDFTINNLGLQVRYRWTFAPQSDLYVVYSRGGYAQDDERARDSTFDLLEDALELRDADQFLVKVRYRFD